MVMVNRCTKKHYPYCYQLEHERSCRESSKNFSEYQKKVKLPGIDLKLHPVVTLPHIKADTPDKPCKPEKEKVVTTSLVPSVVHSENSIQMVERLRLTDSVNQDKGKPKKKVKIYWMKTCCWSIVLYRRPENHHLPK